MKGQSLCVCLYQELKTYRRLLQHKPREKTTDRKNRALSSAAASVLAELPRMGEASPSAKSHIQSNAPWICFKMRLPKTLYFTKQLQVHCHNSLDWERADSGGTFELPLLCVHVELNGTKWRSVWVGFVYTSKLSFPPQCTIKKRPIYCYSSLLWWIYVASTANISLVSKTELGVSGFTVTPVIDTPSAGTDRSIRDEYTFYYTID